MLRGAGQPARPPWLLAQGSCAGASPLSPLGSRRWCSWELHGRTFALLHLACMQMLSVVVPPALAAQLRGFMAASPLAR